MKRLITLLFFVSISISVVAQSPYISQPDPNHPDQRILKGMITKYALINLPEYNAWYQANLKGFTPNANLVTAMTNAKGKVHYVIFGGTWCEDSHTILPKLFTMLEKAGVPDSDISFYGVDRMKKTLGYLEAAFAVTHVPTIIVMVNGIEKGRIVEYGKTGRWDQELADLLK